MNGRIVLVLEGGGDDADSVIDGVARLLREAGAHWSTEHSADGGRVRVEYWIGEGLS